MSVSDKVLKNIEKHKITPKPKWVFTLKNVAIWFSSVVFLLIGGLAFSVVIYMIIESDWELYENLNDSLWEFTLLILPYFWLIILGLLVALANYNLKNTKGGYRYRIITIVTFVFIVSMLIGGILYVMGIGKEIDETFADRIPIYNEFINKINRDKGMWMKPGQGLLAGVIISTDDGVIKISDFNNDIWVVKSNEQTIFKGMKAEINRGIKMIGNEFLEMDALAHGERTFRADFIDVLPDMEWLKHHPMGPRRIIEMRNDGTSQVITPSSFMHMEYEEGGGNQGDKMKCASKNDCMTPFSFMARSNCPFESECINGNCKVVCIMPLNYTEIEKKIKCQDDKDCDCTYYTAGDKIGCICFQGICMAVVN